MISGCDKLNKWIDPWLVLASLPEDFPICFLGGGQSRYSILALKLRPISFEEISQIKCSRNSCRDFGPPFMSGIIGFLGFNYKSLAHIYSVSRTMIFDHSKKAVYVSAADDGSSVEDFQEIDPILLIENAVYDFKSNRNDLPVRLVANESDEEYLDKVRNIKNEIKNGRYYQLNYCRYFKTNIETSRVRALRLMERAGDNYSALLHCPNQKILSLSPERFVSGANTSRGYSLKAYPVKGTIRRDLSPLIDRHLVEELLSSSKDLSELHMIIDLMRNDLQQISKSRSVRVENQCELLSARNVHHLQGIVSSLAFDHLTLGELIDGLCPAGSITGAPKKEVIGAIMEKESMARDFFMGNVFYFDRSSGAFDSSVLIRTLAAKKEKYYAFAAGSGIVLASNEHAELNEVREKCKIILEA